MCSRSNAAWVVALALLFSSSGAEASEKRVSEVVVVEGPGAGPIASWLEDFLNAPDTLQQEETFRGALRARGALPLHRAAGDAARDTRLIACAHAAAGEADVDGALLVDLQKTGNATRIHVWRIDTRPGGSAIESELTLPLSAKVVDQSRAILAVAPMHAAAATPIAAAAPAASAPVPVAPAPVAPVAAPIAPLAAKAPPVEPLAPMSAAPDAPDQVATRHEPGRDRSVLSVEAGVGVGMRHFSYVDRITPSLRPYDLGAAPMASMNGAIYPLGATHTPFVRDFGIIGSYSQAFAFSSEDSSGAHVGASWKAFDAGVTERIALTHALLANVSLGYGGNDFQFDQSATSAAAALPSVAYRFVRAGADLRFTVPTFAAISVSGGGSYLDLLSTGYTSVLFPRQSAGGVEAHLGASYLLAKSVEVSIGASYTRVFYTFNPVPGDADVAGGALDQQARVLAGLSYVM
jgi:hypothetical protein